MKKENRYDYIVYTDGGCAVNPGGAGGIGVVIINTKTGKKKEVSRGYRSTTNNRMEITAVIAALELLPRGCSAKIFSDSQYTINCMRGIWEKRKNTDLWKRVEEAADGKTVDMQWVRGHNGDVNNERCDDLATMAIRDTSHHTDDTGYLEDAWGDVFREKKDSEKRSVGGAMAVNIVIPEDFVDMIPAARTAEEYVKAIGVSSSCARAILQFRSLEKYTFRSYMNLKTGGIDRFSRMNEEELVKGSYAGNAAMKIIMDNLHDYKDALTAMRWHARGLTVEDSIRKVLVDAEVRDNCR